MAFVFRNLSRSTEASALIFRDGFCFLKLVVLWYDWLCQLVLPTELLRYCSWQKLGQIWRIVLASRSSWFRYFCIFRYVCWPYRFPCVLRLVGCGRLYRASKNVCRSSSFVRSVQPKWERWSEHLPKLESVLNFRTNNNIKHIINCISLFVVFYRGVHGVILRFSFLIYLFNFNWPLWC